MQTARTFLGGAMTAAFLSLAIGGSASALTMKECSTKYQEAKKDGTLAGANWKSFRAKECSASGATATTASAPAAAPAPATSMAAPAASSAAPAHKPVAAAATPGSAIFPSAVDPKYSKESAGKARMHTCLDQYKTNKAGSGNGGLRWIQKGGGYYSECNTKLKA